MIYYRRRKKKKDPVVGHRSNWEIKPDQGSAKQSLELGSQCVKYITPLSCTSSKLIER